MWIIGWLGSCALVSGTSPVPINFTTDVAPIIFQHCVPCHRPDQIAPFSLTRYEEVAKRSRQIAEQVSQGTMPPWKPVAGHGNFLEERRLTPMQIQTIKDWVANGAPEGDQKRIPPLPVFKEGFQLGIPDLVFEMPESFSIPAEGDDIYFHFPFPLNLRKESYLRAIEILPGNRRVAHHAVGILDTSGTARKLSQAGGGKGYSRFGGPGFLPAGFTPGYVPGNTPRFFDSDSSIVLKPGTDFVLQMHYHPSGKVEKDRTQVGLYLSETKPPRNIGGILMGSEAIDIPPGEKIFKVKDCYELPVDFEARAIWAHMHLIGKKVFVQAELPNGDNIPILRIDDWDFHWQDTYQFAKPIRFPKGTKIHSEFQYDNSSANPHNPNTPPKRITLGENSTDEMAGLWIGGVTVKPSDELTMWLSVLNHYLEIHKNGFKK